MVIVCTHSINDWNQKVIVYAHMHNHFFSLLQPNRPLLPHEQGCQTQTGLGGSTELTKNWTEIRELTRNQTKIQFFKHREPDLFEICGPTMLVS